MIAILTGIILGISIFFSLFGLGGGVLYVPILEMFRFPLKEVVIPLSLLMNGIAGILSLIVFSRKRMVQWKTAIPVAIASVICSPLGTLIMLRLPTTTIHLFFGILLLFVGMRMSFAGSHTDSSPKIKSPALRTFLAICMGGIAGSTSGMLGGGAGSILVPALLFFGFSTKESAGISSLMVASSSFMGFFVQVKCGDYKLLDSLPILFPVIIAVIFGSVIGSSLAVRVKNPTILKRLFGGALLVIAFKFLFISR